MQNIQNNTRLSEAGNSIPLLDQEHGYYGSVSATTPPGVVYAFCQRPENVGKVLKDLPEGLKNFLHLDLGQCERVGEDQYRIQWLNRPGAPAKGTLVFLLKASPFKGGTIITAEAVFEGINFKEEGPSTLVSVFLKRMKALMETGVIATTTGQSSGREEIQKPERKTIQ